MKQVARLLMMVTGVLLIASWAKAQEQMTDLARPWGASVTAGAQYTDNRDGTKTNKHPNLDFYIEPRGDLFWRDGERTTLDIFLSPLAKWHSNPREGNDGQHSTDLFGSGGFDLTHELDPRLGLKINDTASYDDDPSIDLGGTAVRQSSSLFMNSAAADVSAEVTPQIALEFIGHDTVKRYDDKAVADNNDEDSYDAEVDLGYLLGEGYKVFGMGEISDFESKSTTRDRGAKIYEGGVGVEKFVSADVHARLVGGYQYAEYKDATLGDNELPNGRLEVVYRPQAPTRFRGSFLYGFYMPYVQPYSVQKLTGVQAAVDHDVIPQRLTVTVRGQYSHSQYDAEGVDAPGGADKLASVGMDATYRFSRHWSCCLSYTFEDWQSDVREPFDQSILDASVKATF